MRKLLLCLIMIPALAGCGGVNFAATPESSNVSKYVEQLLKTLQPALAVRAISCLMCHSDVRANIVTDFGLGQNFYLGGSARFDDMGWYNNYVSTWQTSQQILGSVYVPDANVTASAQAILGAGAWSTPMKLKDFLLTPYVPISNWNNDYTARAVMDKVQPANPLDSAVIAKSKIVIRAPQDSEIRALDATFFADATAVKAKRVGSTAPIQFVVKDNGLGKFIMNDENSVLDCRDSDILVNGSLYLRGLKVSAAKGCRLYVTGTVFIEDAVTYSPTDLDPSLQITSARGIVMGINQARLKNRLIADNRGLELRDFDFATLANQILADAAAVGTTRDALDDYGGVRASINYSGLLLNAPVVHSRYLGTVKGTIVAEAALFALGAFHFEFDDVLTRISVLPLLTSSILTVE